mgnify:CR=1 FL=1
MSVQETAIAKFSGATSITAYDKIEDLGTLVKRFGAMLWASGLL